MHRAQLENIERLVVKTLAQLEIQKGTRRLEALDYPRATRQDRQNEKDDRQTNRDVETPFKKTVDGILQWLVPQTEKTHAAVFKDRERLAKCTINISYHHEPDTVLLTKVRVTEHPPVAQRKFGDNDHADARRIQQLLQIARSAQLGECRIVPVFLFVG
jgi:hypothetical protein